MDLTTSIIMTNMPTSHIESSKSSMTDGVLLLTDILKSFIQSVELEGERVEVFLRAASA